MESSLIWLDPALIKLFRITGHAYVDFWAGTFLTALVALLIGEVTSSWAHLISRKHLAEGTAEMERYKAISEKALRAGDGASYRAANKMANEAFGTTFFRHAAMSASLLWPVFFAMAWMGTRFSAIEFHVPFLDRSVGWPFVFVCSYLAAYLCFRPVKWRLPYFSWVKRMIDSPNHDAARSFASEAP